MSPFGAVSRNRGSRKPLAYNSILNPGGALGCAAAGRSTTCARLIAKAFELGGGKSWTVILRVTPGASLVQSPIAALPVSSLPLSAALPIGTITPKLAAIKIAQKNKSPWRRFCIHVSNRFGPKDRVDRLTVHQGSCQVPLQRIIQCAIAPSFSTSVAPFLRSLITNVLFSPRVDHGPRGTSLKSTNLQSVTSVLCSPR